PLGPRKPTISPDATLKLTSSTAGIPRKLRQRCCSSSMRAGLRGLWELGEKCVHLAQYVGFIGAEDEVIRVGQADDVRGWVPCLESVGLRGSARDVFRD